MSLLADLRAWGVVALVSVLGVGSALVPYNVGKHGLEAVLARFPQVGQARLERVRDLYQKHGSGLLFFSFVPFLGMLLAAGAGVVGVRASAFVLWVLAGRVLRNSILLLLVALGLVVLGA